LSVNLLGQAEKTLVKSIATSTTTSSSNKAIFQLPGKSVVSLWDEDFIRITTHIKVDNMNENIVKQLLMVGRYTISSNLNEDNQTLLVFMPKISNKITVKGIQLSEELAFEISIPKGYSTQIIKEIDNLVGQSL
jgi:hypothetical protein